MGLFVMEGVSKRYGGVRALQDAALVIEAGRIHAVLGENGAGKSTLIKIMAGVVAPDEGRMLLDGEPVSFASPAAAVAFFAHLLVLVGNFLQFLVRKMFDVDHLVLRLVD